MSDLKRLNIYKMVYLPNILAYDKKKFIHNCFIFWISIS